MSIKLLISHYFISPEVPPMRLCETFESKWKLCILETHSERATYYGDSNFVIPYSRFFREHLRPAMALNAKTPDRELPPHQPRADFQVERATLAETLRVQPSTKIDAEPLLPHDREMWVLARFFDLLTTFLHLYVAGKCDKLWARCSIAAMVDCIASTKQRPLEDRENDAPQLTTHIKKLVCVDGTQPEPHLPVEAVSQLANVWQVKMPLDWSLDGLKLVFNEGKAMESDWLMMKAGDFFTNCLASRMTSPDVMRKVEPTIERLLPYLRFEDAVKVLDSCGENLRSDFINKAKSNQARKLIEKWDMDLNKFENVVFSQQWGMLTHLEYIGGSDVMADFVSPTSRTRWLTHVKQKLLDKLIENKEMDIAMEFVLDHWNLSRMPQGARHHLEAHCARVKRCPIDDWAADVARQKTMRIFPLPSIPSEVKTSRPRQCLPSAEFLSMAELGLNVDKDVALVQTQSDVLSMMTSLQSEAFVTLDAEWYCFELPSNPSPVALMQICAPSVMKSYLVDLHTIDKSPEASAIFNTLSEWLGSRCPNQKRPVGAPILLGFAFQREDWRRLRLRDPLAFAHRCDCFDIREFLSAIPAARDHLNQLVQSLSGTPQNRPRRRRGKQNRNKSRGAPDAGEGEDKHDRREDSTCGGLDATATSGQCCNDVTPAATDGDRGDVRGVLEEGMGGVNKDKKLKDMSLSDLCYIILKKGLNKKWQLSEWERRPLESEKAEYAALDVLALALMVQRVANGAGFASVKAMLQTHDSSSCPHGTNTDESRQCQVRGGFDFEDLRKRRDVSG
eukprot:GHVN01034565.1.p1 GENE.GHVN01034565.1~~GHVN01034565.1.p1  ORF type:complete len:790 (+),score=102.88 GHVN01034565.1:1657-4026(+)